MKSVNDFTLQALKEKCKFYGIATSGTKVELFTRLVEKFPEGEWMQDSEELDESVAVNEDGNVAEATQTVHTPCVVTKQSDQSEMLLMKKQAELFERELALARREIELLRVTQRRSLDEEDRSSRASAMSNPTNRAELSITAIASSLDYFHGNNDSYEKWERQVRLLKTTYKLEDSEAKLLITLRLKGKASEWFHSRPELIEMNFEGLLSQLKTMYCHRVNKMVRRKKFEERVWKKGELFGEYFHEKTILAIRVPIDADEMVDYLIEGIPDASLRDQARIQRFSTPASLLEAFSKITLRKKVTL